jgi:dihydroflavonol-4-reductase
MVLVTGASGHVGANLVRSLLEQGRDVRCLVHSDSRALDGLNVELVQGDVTDPDTLAPAMVDVSTVFHCAAVISIVGDMGGLVRRVNVDGVRNMATAARAAGVQRFVHISSCHAFDLTLATASEISPRPGAEHPAYDRSKAAGEAALREFSDDLSFCVLNPSGVIGPWDFAPSRMGTAFRDVRDGKLPGAIDGGFYFSDVRDIVAAMLAAETRGGEGENYLLGGHYHRVDKLIALAADVAGVKPPWLTSPMWLARIGAPFMTAWASITGQEPLYTAEALFALRTPPDNFDQTKAKTTLGFEPTPTRDTLEAVFESFARLKM